jgi:hypothetical protein
VQVENDWNALSLQVRLERRLVESIFGERTKFFRLAP